MRKSILQIYILLFLCILENTYAFSKQGRMRMRKQQKVQQIDQIIKKKRMLNEQSESQKMRITYEFSALNSIQNEDIKQIIMDSIKLTINFYSDMVKVKYPIQVPFRIPENEFNCKEMYTYTDEQKQTEFMESDLHILVTYVDNPDEWYLAYAGGCLTDSYTGRNILGVVNFNIGYINIQSHYDFYNLLVTTEHELFHVIALDSTLYPNYSDTNVEYYPEDNYLNQEGVLKFPQVQKWVREHYNCQSLEGMLLENEGTSGSAGVHWEKYVLFDETMNAAGDEGYWCDLNNALMKDSGWYEVDRTKHDKITYGKGLGCDFFINKCYSKIQYKEFCYKSGEIGPSVSYHAAAKCSNQDSFTDGCLTMRPVKTCFDTSYNELESSKLFNESFGYNSRIFYSTLTPNSQAEKERLQCYQYSCIGNTQINILFGDNILVCTSNNQIINSPDSNFKGSLKCPNILDFCSKQQKCPHFCSSKGYCIKDECVCEDDYSGPGCECPPYYFYNSQQKKCNKCSDENNCINCDSKDSANCLKCFNGFFLNGKCEQCSSNCESCENTSDNCLSCKTGLTLTKQNQCTECPLNCSICKQQTPSECLVCIDGKGLDSQKNCSVNCQKPCKTCNSQGDKCLTCLEGMYLKENKCFCRDGTFYDASNGICSQCSYLCKKCQDSKSCDICLDTYSINSSTKLCSKCQDKFFENTKGECQTCHSSCQTCFGSADNCTKCYSDSIMIDANKCRCKEQNYYIDNEGFCQPCNSNCLTCSNKNKCITCDTGLFLKDNICRSCKSYEYSDEFGKCQSCDQGCLTCYGPSANQCKSCSPSLVFNDVDHTCDKCHRGLFFNQKQSCEQCSPKCKTCKNSPDECITSFCKSNEYYSSDKNCKKCSDNCQVCSSSRECLKCKTNYQLDSSKTCILSSDKNVINENPNNSTPLIAFKIILVILFLIY